MVTLDNQVGFVVGTGRCGTRFINRVVGIEPLVASSHERNVLNESFHRYCRWYGLPVDDEGFLHVKESEIHGDLENHAFSFEASAQLSSSIEALYRRFNARFVLLVRRPHQVVNSFIRKGHYTEPFVRANENLALGYQASRSFHHFLGRIAPSGDKFLQWNRMSRVGKLAWLWSAVNATVLKQFKRIPNSHQRIVKLEELTYDQYGELAEFLGFKITLTREKYEEISQSRPNAQTGVPDIAQWSRLEIAEFEAEVAPVADTLGYTFKVQDLAMKGTSLRG
ncbi:MAG: hypothetical protein ABIK28_04305 [Planctomycetota bacterium]